MTKKETIDLILAQKKIALAGVSRNPKKFGSQVFKKLLENGYEVLPVNPNAEQIDGISCYKNVADLPDDCKTLVIVTKPAQTDQVVQEAIGRGIQNIWIQQMSETKTAVELAQKSQVNLVTRECIFMYSEPVKGPHAFHRFMRKLFRRMPK